jgi:hypothetical protein
MTTPTQPSSGGGGGGNVFTRKLGPLPMWAWMGIALAIALVFYLINKNKSASSAQQTAAANSDVSGTTEADSTDQSLIPQFVNQTYTNVQPPAAPAAAAPAPTTSTSTTNQDYSVTAQGNMTLAQMAQWAGVSPSAFGGSNAAAKTFLTTTYKKNAKALIPKGAQFTYTKAPKLTTTTTTT